MQTKPRSTYRGQCARCKKNTSLKNMLCRTCRDANANEPRKYEPIKKESKGQKSPWAGTLRLGKRIPQHIKATSGWYSGAGEPVKLLIKFGENQHD